MTVAALRRDVGAPLAPAAFAALLHELAAAQRLLVASGLAQLPGHDASANPADRRLWERVYPFLLEAGAAAPTVAELATDADCDERMLRDMLYRRRKTGGVWRVGNDRFYARPTFGSLAASAAALAAASADHSFTAAEFRDVIGTGRTLAIEILDALDAAGVTVRVGDRRRMQHDFVPILGPATPIQRRASRGSAPGAPLEHGPGGKAPKRPPPSVKRTSA